jgi:proteasome lid subunit RPN8/RPN11
LQSLVGTAGQLWLDLKQTWLQRREPLPSAPPGLAGTAGKYGSLERVTLTDEVGRTLFDEYAAHRQGPRGHEETGWVILGRREATEAIVLATLPAGTQRSAGVAHVQFNSSGQALASRIVRQADRKLTMLGVVHTHPGSLRHPSDGDYRGDSQWVGRLRGQEGVFGIGTADGAEEGNNVYARNVKAHVHCLGSLCFSWYALKANDRGYRPLPCDWTLGPDLARPLHSLWPTIELHAERLDRLCCQQAVVRFEVVSGHEGPALAVILSLAEPGHALRVLLEGKTVRYYWVRDGEILKVGMDDDYVDRGVYLLLAELAAQS